MSERTRRLLWRCPLCYKLVPREREACDCGASKEAWRALARPRSRPTRSRVVRLLAMAAAAGLLVLLVARL